jgi:endogenous inhibitor of DNA gyrase (YacG/DUF329 family)
MTCPICKKDVPLNSDFLPFCSERCKLIDLGNWASEKYVIPVPLDPEDVPEDVPEDAPEDAPDASPDDDDKI